MLAQSLLIALLVLIVAALAGIAFSAAVVASGAWLMVSYLWSFAGFLLQTWVPQTLLAAWVAFQLQEIAATNGRRNDRLESTYHRKVEATKRMYGLIEKRLYASRRYLEAIRSEPNAIAAEREVYKAVVDEWNSTVKLSQVDILLEFRGDLGLSLDHFYFPTFSEVDALLRKQRLRVQAGKKPDPASTKSINELLAIINVNALGLTRSMLLQARRDRNIMDETIEISEVNARHLSYRRLFKALVEPLA